MAPSFLTLDECVHYAAEFVRGAIADASFLVNSTRDSAVADRLALARAQLVHMQERLQEIAASIAPDVAVERAAADLRAEAEAEEIPF